ncbi:MAG: oligosaccharide flippase family protein, partial [Bdellovibrionales bacterium]|nr:oligosaccharide flippase family protein [Bdellovibrionales bacterium]
TVPDSQLRRELHFKPRGIMEASIGFVRGCLVLVLAWAGFGYWALIAGVLFRELAVCLWVIVVRGLPRGVRWDSALYRQAIRFGIPATVSSIFWTIFSTADKVVVGKLFGVDVLGYYAMAFYLTDLPLSKLNEVLNPVLTPYFSRLKSDMDSLRRAFLKIVGLVSLLMAPILAGLAVVAPQAVDVVLGEKWYALIAPLQVMCFVGLLRSLTGNVASLLYAINKPGSVLRYNFICVLVLPASFVLLGTWYGISGVYGTWLVVFPFVSFYALTILRRETEIALRDYFSKVLPAIISSLFMALAVLGIKLIPSGHLTPALDLVLCVGIGAAIFAMTMWLVFRSTVSEVLSAVRGLRN